MEESTYHSFSQSFNENVSLSTERIPVSTPRISRKENTTSIGSNNTGYMISTMERYKSNSQPSSTELDRSKTDMENTLTYPVATHPPSQPPSPLPQRKMNMYYDEYPDRGPSHGPLIMDTYVRHHQDWIIPRRLMCAFFWVGILLLFTGIVLLVTSKHQGGPKLSRYFLTCQTMFMFMKYFGYMIFACRTFAYRHLPVAICLKDILPANILHVVYWNVQHWAYTSWGSVMLGLGFCLLLICFILCMHAYCVISEENNETETTGLAPMRAVPPSSHLMTNSTHLRNNQNAHAFHNGGNRTRHIRESQRSYGGVSPNHSTSTKGDPEVESATLESKVRFHLHPNAVEAHYTKETPNLPSKSSDAVHEKVQGHVKHKRELNDDKLDLGVIGKLPSYACQMTQYSPQPGANDYSHGIGSVSSQMYSERQLSDASGSKSTSGNSKSSVSIQTTPTVLERTDPMLSIIPNVYSTNKSSTYVNTGTDSNLLMIRKPNLFQENTEEQYSSGSLPKRFQHGGGHVHMYENPMATHDSLKLHHSLKPIRKVSLIYNESSFDNEHTDFRQREHIINSEQEPQPFSVGDNTMISTTRGSNITDYKSQPFHKPSQPQVTSLNIDIADTPISAMNIHAHTRLAPSEEGSSGSPAVSVYDNVNPVWKAKSGREFKHFHF